MSLCPCGTEKDYKNCCEPFLDGAKQPPTAEALMRSRYTAYVKQRIAYIEESHEPDSREDFDREAATAWSKNTEWLGLEVKKSEAGGENDEEGTVEFIARFKPKDMPEEAHHELAYFRRLDGRWFYSDGKVVRQPIQRSSPKIGRNDPCTCGSGKKFKKCCALTSSAQS